MTLRKAILFIASMTAICIATEVIPTSASPTPTLAAPTLQSINITVPQPTSFFVETQKKQTCNHRPWLCPPHDNEHVTVVTFPMPQMEGYADDYTVAQTGEAQYHPVTDRTPIRFESNDPSLPGSGVTHKPAPVKPTVPNTIPTPSNTPQTGTDTDTPEGHTPPDSDDTQLAQNTPPVNYVGYSDNYQEHARTVQVPEPSSALLLIPGVIFLCLLRKKNLTTT